MIDLFYLRVIMTLSIANVATRADRNNIPHTPRENQTWLGRKFHRAKGDHIRIVAIMSIFFLAIGTLLLFMLPLSTVSIPATLALIAGSGLGIYAIKKARQPNELEEALNHLVGGKKRLDQLPEVKSVPGSNGYFTIKLEDMTQNIMRVTHKGKTHGVAFHHVWYHEDAARPDRSSIQVYLFKPPFKKFSEPQFATYSLSSSTCMYPFDGRFYEKMIRKGNFRKKGEAS